MKSVVAALLIAGMANACHPFLGASVHTNQEFKYGRFLTRMLPAMKKGTVSSFFMYWTGPNWRESQWNEIDIEYAPTETMNGFNINLIYGDGHSKKMDSHKLDYGDTSVYHEVGYEWTPDYIAWLIDGQVHQKFDRSHESVRFMNKHQHLEMNMWTPTFAHWHNGLDWHEMPFTTKYDYVEVYSYDENTKEFHFEWKDDFNTLDYSRWHVTDNGTFGQNSCIFKADHVKVEDGNLVFTLGKNPQCEPRDLDLFLQD